MIRISILSTLVMCLLIPSSAPAASLFGPPTKYYVGTVVDPYIGAERSRNEVLFGDFDGDGALDICIVNDKSSAAFSILYGTGNGAFEPRRTYAFGGGPSESDFLVLDSNNDGRKDIAIANGFPWFQVELSDGAREWTPGPVGFYSSERKVTYLLGVTDCNHDSAKDIIAYCEPRSTSYNSYFDVFQYSNGNYIWSSETAFSDRSYRHPVGDFNYDRLTDCIDTWGMNQGVITPLYGTNQCALAAGTTWDDLGVTEMVVGDFNGDHYSDIAYTRLFMEQGCGVFIVHGSSAGLLNDDMQYYQWLSENQFDNDCNGRIWAADFDGDRLCDMAVSDGRFYETTGVLPVYVHYSGGNTFSSRVDTVSLHCARFACPLAADFNGDGKADFCFLTSPDTLTVFLSETPIATSLKSFDARFDATRGAVLEWEVSEATDCKAFCVSRAWNGGEFAEIAVVAAQADQRRYRFVDESVKGRAPRKAVFQLEVIGKDGSRRVLASEEVWIPGMSFALHQNYPNPFNPLTVISFDLGAAERVWLDVYDASGKLVRSLVRGVEMGPGSQIERWDGTNDKGERVSSGIYYYRLRAGKNDETRKMILLR